MHIPCIPERSAARQPYGGDRAKRATHNEAISVLSATFGYSAADSVLFADHRTDS